MALTEFLSAKTLPIRASNNHYLAAPSSMGEQRRRERTTLHELENVIRLSPLKLLSALLG
jgi:hypothetical protein